MIGQIGRVCSKHFILELFLPSMQCKQQLLALTFEILPSTHTVE